MNRLAEVCGASARATPDRPQVTARKPLPGWRDRHPDKEEVPAFRLAGGSSDQVSDDRDVVLGLPRTLTNKLSRSGATCARHETPRTWLRDEAAAGSCKELRCLISAGFQGCMSIPGWSGRWRRLGIASKHSVRVLEADGQVVCRASCVPTVASLSAVERAALAGAPEGTRLAVVFEPTGPAWMPVAVFFARRGHSVYRVSSAKAADLRRFLRRHAKSNGI